MGLKLIIISIVMILYTIGYTIKFLYNRKNMPGVLIKYRSDWELYVLVFIFAFAFNFIPNNGESERLFFSLFIIAAVIVVFSIYLVFSRTKDKKLTILNCGEEEVYEKILYDTLDKNKLLYSWVAIQVIIKGTKASVKFINRGFVIKNYKEIPNYKDFIAELERNIKASPFIRNKRGEVAAIILLTIITLILIGETILINSFF